MKNGGISFQSPKIGSVVSNSGTATVFGWAIMFQSPKIGSVVSNIKNLGAINDLRINCFNPLKSGQLFQIG